MLQPVMNKDELSRLKQLLVKQSVLMLQPVMNMAKLSRLKQLSAGKAGVELNATASYEQGKTIKTNKAANRGNCLHG